VIIRIFDTAIDPEDVERAKELFRVEVRPAFEAFDGCLGIEMAMGIEEHSKDLVDVASISRWESEEAIETATGTDEYSKALSGIRQLFQQTPIVRHFELVE
jgi:heme-degrading monooxygenase HmoA